VNRADEPGRLVPASASDEPDATTSQRRACPRQIHRLQPAVLRAMNRSSPRPILRAHSTSGRRVRRPRRRARRERRALHELVEEPEYRHDRSRVDVGAARLVVERDVATDNRDRSAAQAALIPSIAEESSHITEGCSGFRSSSSSPARPDERRRRQRSAPTRRRGAPPFEGIDGSTSGGSRPRRAPVALPVQGTPGPRASTARRRPHRDRRPCSRRADGRTDERSKSGRRGAPASRRRCSRPRSRSVAGRRRTRLAVLGGAIGRW
jgi:hypothetical protein